MLNKLDEVHDAFPERVLGSFALAHRIVLFPGLKFSRIVDSSFSNLTKVKELDILDTQACLNNRIFQNENNYMV